MLPHQPHPFLHLFPPLRRENDLDVLAEDRMVLVPAKYLERFFGPDLRQDGDQVREHISQHIDLVLGRRSAVLDPARCEICVPDQERFLFLIELHRLPPSAYIDFVAHIFCLQKRNAVSLSNSIIVIVAGGVKAYPADADASSDRNAPAHL